MPLYPYMGQRPELDPTAWVAPTASVIGRVRVGARSSLWFGVTVRGDVHHIQIGAATNVQDNTLLHVTHEKFPCLVGDRVTIGHGAIVHACTLEDECLVGMGAVVLDGATVQTGAMVAAGAVVSPGKVVPSGSIWAGTPARELRPMTDAEKSYLAWSAAHYATLAERYGPLPA